MTNAIPKIHRMDTMDFRKRFKDAPFNPPERLSPRGLKPLVDSMKTHGFIPSEPIRVHGKFITDGHRRLHAALLAQTPDVYYMETELDVQTYWAVVNGTGRAPSVKEAGRAVQLGLKVFPANRQRILTQLQEVAGGWDQMREILEKASPGIVLPARRIANYCFDEGKWDDTRNEFVVRAMQWMMTHKMQRVVLDAIAQEGITPEALFEKIINDQPLRSRFE